MPSPTQISDVALMRQAHMMFDQRRPHDAKLLCLEMLKRKPNDYQALILLIEVSMDCRERKQAMDYAQRVVKAYPRDGQAAAKLASVYNRTGRHKEALQVLEKFRKKYPEDVFAINSMARTYEYLGELDKAISLLEPFIQAKTETAPMAHHYATMKFEQKQYQTVLEIESRHILNPAVDPGIREAMCFLLGRTHEALKDYDKAFAAYTAANNILPNEDRMALRIAEHNDIIEAFSADWMKRLPRGRNDSRLPVFIVCMPRSGSTLVERIISAHPKVHAGGEDDCLYITANQLNLTIGSFAPYPKCVHDLDQNDIDQVAGAFLHTLQSIGPGAERVTNKYLWTWKYLGLLALMCPKAAIIDLRRNPLDNCIGLYTAHMHAGESYARDLKQIATLQLEYERMMTHWHSVLDVPILKMNYEDLVEDQETWTRRLIEFCGLEWDDRCLTFYEKGAQQSSTAAPTLSYQQVRQPIYKSSVSRAKKFQKHLGPLYEALGLPYPPNAE